MKDKFKTGGEVLKRLIKTGGDVADKALDKSSDVATVMMNNMTGLISKLSNDIGVMANRILTMEERIGMMADRIVRMEELMAKFTATLANKDLDLSPNNSGERKALQTVVLDVDTTGATEHSGPALSITGNPDRYLLYVSTSPLFQDGSTIISQIKDADDYDSAWKRSINVIRGLKKTEDENNDEVIIVAVAVKAEADNNQLTALSNSIDIAVLGVST